MNPEESKLRIEPIQREEKKTFCECAHVLGVPSPLRQKLLNLGPSELRNLRTLGPGGSAVRTGRNETRLVLVEVKSQSPSSSGEWRCSRKTSKFARSRNQRVDALRYISYDSMWSLI